MRIAIISDIHGNLTALEAVLADLRQTSPDLTLHGGDLAANGANPAKVVDKIRDLAWPGVRGNTDEMLWAPECLTELAVQVPKLQPLFRAFQEMAPKTREWLGEERLTWLHGLPRTLQRGPVALVHASPDNLWRALLPTASDAELQSVYGPLGAPIAVYAHIHRPYIRRLPEMRVANTGSVSLSYDGDPRASYLLLDDLNLTIRRVEYDIDAEARALLQCGLPGAVWLCKILRSGRYESPS
jgi:predicted phosphodiesterase